MDVSVDQPVKKIKYAELTVIKNSTNRSMMNSLVVLFGAVDEELIVDNENDKLIMMFEDDEILFDVKDRYVDCDYEFIDGLAINGLYSEILWINTRNIINHIFPKKPIRKDNRNSLYFKELLDNYSKHTKGCPSYFNMILYRHTSSTSNGTNDIFWIYRIGSSNSKPRYLIGYDDSHFTKEEVVYMVTKIMTKPYSSVPCL